MDFIIKISKKHFVIKFLQIIQIRNFLLMIKNYLFSPI